MEIITSGKLLNAFKSILNKMGEMFKDTCESLGRQGVVCTDYKEDATGKQLFEFTFKTKEITEAGETVQDHKLSVVCTPVKDKENTYDVKFTADTGKPATKPNLQIVKKGDLEKLVMSYIQQSGGTDIKSKIIKSNQIKISLQKIVGCDETQIVLNSVMCGENIIPQDAISIIDDLCSNDEFVADIPECEDAFYCIDNSEDEFEVNPCEDYTEGINQFDILNTIIKMINGIESHVKWLAYNLCSEEAKKYWNQLWVFSSMYDDIIGLMRNRRGNDTMSITVPGTTVENTDSCRLADYMHDAYAYMDLNYPNFQHDEKWVLDSVMNRIKDLMNSFGFEDVLKSLNC